MKPKTKQEIFTDSIYLESLCGYRYFLPGFLPVVLNPKFRRDHERNYTIALDPKRMTKPHWKVKRNTLPPATWPEEQQTSFENRIRRCDTFGWALRTNIIIRPLKYLNVYEVWNGFNQLQCLLSRAEKYPKLHLLIKIVNHLPEDNEGYHACYAKAAFVWYRKKVGRID